MKRKVAVVKTRMFTTGRDGKTGELLEEPVPVQSIVVIESDDTGGFFIELREVDVGRFVIHPRADNVIRIEVLPPPVVTAQLQEPATEHPDVMRLVPDPPDTSSDEEGS